LLCPVNIHINPPKTLTGKIQIGKEEKENREEKDDKLPPK